MEVMKPRKCVDCGANAQSPYILCAACQDRRLDRMMDRAGGQDLGNLERKRIMDEARQTRELLKGWR